MRKIFLNKTKKFPENSLPLPKNRQKPKWFQLVIMTMIT